MDKPEAVTTQDSTVEQWTAALAQSTGSPGGGAGAGLMLAIAASLISMVAGYTDAQEPQVAHVPSLRRRALELRQTALRLADEDASASQAFGAAFHLEPGRERETAIKNASINAARASATLGKHAVMAIDDLEWLALNGNQALISDVVVALGSLRATLAGARTNVSFDLASSTTDDSSMAELRRQHQDLFAALREFEAAIERLDMIASGIDRRAAPTRA
ncbi:cyclodeaminase/cyclohydrolase family protein [Glutamicibacter creatinolyticus]|uniref:cyclodeaminase/cyclohydrolase family protein n=1 Tax=Glutamicibacter creatinolyticus TaxID=162496 RepID=UPI0032173BB0